MPRKKQFTVEHVLDRAVRTFSENGYHATSIEDLVQAMGIKRGSMYDTFDSKRNLFLRALRHHLEVEGGALEEIVEQVPSPAEALMAVAARVASDRFMLRASVEMAAHDDEIGPIVAAAQREVALLFGELIGRGRRAGEIDGAVDPVQAGSALLGLCIGAGVVATSPVALLQQAGRCCPRRRERARSSSRPRDPTGSSGSTSQRSACGRPAVRPPGDVPRSRPARCSAARRRGRRAFPHGRRLGNGEPLHADVHLARKLRVCHEGRGGS